MDIFLTKTHEFAAGDLYSPQEPSDARFITDARTLFYYFWTVENTHLLPLKRLEEQGQSLI